MNSIIIVDDEKDTVNSIKLLLEKKGFKVSTASNVKDCKKKLEKESPDLILLDLLLPGESVNDLIKNNTDIKFIIVSAYISEDLDKTNLDKELIETLKSPNVVGKISKPFNNENLLDLVTKNLK
jgi:DNA-binding NtrC family response regulator